MASPVASNQQQNPSAIDEGVLSDVLDQLDRERSQRAELEAKVRELVQNEKDSKPGAKGNGEISRKQFIALETEKEGLEELLDALLSDTPAFQAANKTTSLPLHALRLLEIMPWDSRSRQHAIGKEELYEWQFYQQQKKQWIQQIRQFPSQFRNLPIIQPKPGEEADFKRKGIFGDVTYPPKHVVLTDAKLSYVVNIDKGYPLPDDGTEWQWVSGWRVDKHVEVLEKERRMDCDGQGWSYAIKPSDFSVRELCWDSAADEKGTVLRPYRRRRWTRRRVLVSYPNASQPTLEYLRLLAENMRLGVNMTKLSDQLVETKTSLTEREAELLETKERNRIEEKRLKTRLKKAEDLLNEIGLGQDLEADKKDNDGSLLVRAECLRKEQTEKIQKVFRQSSWHGSSREDEEVDGTVKAVETDQRFDWKRIARGPFSPARMPVGKPSRDDTALLSLNETEEPQSTQKQGERIKEDEGTISFVQS
jgi:hypothetical protein